MTRPRAVPCKHLRMRPLALAAGQERRLLSSAICENAGASQYGQVLRDQYDAALWAQLSPCHSCPHYQALRP